MFNPFKIFPLLTVALLAASLLVISSSSLANSSLSKQNETAKRAPQLPIELFTKHPIARGIKLSPDGKHITLILKHQDEDKLVVMSLETMTNVAMFRVKGDDKAINQVYWVNNERIIYTSKSRFIGRNAKYNNGQIYGANIDGTRNQAIFGRYAPSPSFGHNQIIDLLPNDDKKILVAFYPWRSAGNDWLTNDEAKPILYKLDVYRGKTSRLGRLPTPLAEGISDHNGNVRFSIGEQQHTTVIHHRANNNAKWQLWQPWLAPEFEGSGLMPKSFDRSNQQVYVSAAVNEGTSALYRFDLNSKNKTQLFHHPKVDISRLIYSADKQQVVAVRTHLDQPEYHYLAENDPMAKLHLRLRESFEGSDINIISVNTDGSKVVFFQYSDTDPGNYYLYDLNTDQAKFLLANRQWIDPNHMASTQTITVKARDGQTLHGYLTTPSGQDNNLPLVVLPHGGPHGLRDYWGFDWEVQLLANRGYGVLQINYRGSDGFGDSFEQQGYKQWGGKIQQDITDATKAMIKKGYADKNRICIYGGSFGAYSAMMGAIRNPDLYQCAIGSSGMYDLPLMVKDSDISENENGKAYFDKVLNKDISWLRNNSPSYNTDKLKAAVLLIHGTTDNRTPITQAEAMTDALNRAKKPYLYYPIGQEGHGYYSEKNRLFVYGKILTFLQEHIGDE